MSWEQYREEGNKAAQRGDHREAERLYSEALRECESVAALWTNRALQRHAMQRYEEALSDAQRAIEIDGEWLKGHFCKVRALQALGRAEDAQVAFSVAVDHGALQNVNFAALEESVTEDYIRVHYDKLTEKMGVAVRWIDGVKKKGLFATRDVRMFQPVFSETPIVSLRKVQTIPQRKDDGKPPPPPEDCCSACLRRMISKQEVETTKFGPFFKEIYEGGSTPPYVWCPDCEKRKEESTERDPAKMKDAFVAGNPFFLEKYCSEACRDRADKLWHRVLCGAHFVSDAKRVHPLHHLYSLCVELQRSNPLLICRIFAMILLRIVNGADPDHAFQDFRNFISSEEPSPHDEAAVFLLKNLLCANAPFMERIVTLSNYRRLNGAIMRNAQTINPVSDLHMWFENALKKEKKEGELMARVGFTPDTLKDYMAKPEMLALNKIEGYGLLPVANCMNHSCDPNIISSSSHNNDTVTFVALRPIQAGEELCISYVDDNLTWQERHKLLREFYRFECKCIRCHVQKENVKIYE